MGAGRAVASAVLRPFAAGRRGYLAPISCALSSAFAAPAPRRRDQSCLRFVDEAVGELHPDVGRLAPVGHARQHLAAGGIGQLGDQRHLAGRGNDGARAADAGVGRVDVEVDDAGLHAQHVGRGVGDDLIAAAGLELARELLLDQLGHAAADGLLLLRAQLERAAGAVGFHDGLKATSTGSSLTRL